ncbi:MAG: hypothetical protein ACE3L7_02310 [Candidatus Pristimantibacillus sp.]
MSWENAISITSIVANIGLTVVVIYLTSKGATANEKNAKAAQDSADAARLSYELSKQMFEMQKSEQQRYWEALRRRYYKIVLDNALYCHDALLRGYSITQPYQTSQNSITKMKTAPTECGLTNEQLAEYFNNEEIEQIDKGWKAFNSFKGSHYFEHGFDSEQENLAISEAHIPIMEITNVINILERNRPKSSH